MVDWRAEQTQVTLAIPELKQTETGDRALTIEKTKTRKFGGSQYIYIAEFARTGQIAK